MSDFLDSVKGLMRLYAKWMAESTEKGEERQVKVYEERITALRALVDEVEHFRRVTKPVPASYGDLSDLPPELVKELTGIKVDDLEQQLFTIIKTGGKEVDLDAILIELFRRFEVLQTRKFLQNKLWRMAQKEVIYTVSGRKGVYTATKPVDEFEGVSVPPPNEPAPQSDDWGQGGGRDWGAPRKRGFADDLDDDIPF